jgi:PhzF family phenazine biosynthesis protein
LTLETGAGVIPVEVAGSTVSTVQVAPDFGAVVPAEVVAGVYGLPVEAIVHPPQIVSTGLPFCVTLLRDKADVEAARLDPDGLAAYFAHLGVTGTDMMEPFLVCREGATGAGDTFARLLLAPPSPPEDPFTGSATGAMAAYLWRHGLIARPDFVAEQGHRLGRPGSAQVSVLGPREAITGVRVSGQGYVLMSGVMHL